ncbi:F-box domain [Dillenia turbinata]|uniref:F-box domain n=1 Tax=Dillenia turbinata TaxID=194707 RepID=A0AAN8Z7N0_9MAGN
MDHEEDEDKFSNLPEQIISHILSFLPIKYAASTSILSPKFKSLWLDITDLEFEDDHLFHPDKFRDFVESILIRCSSPTIHRFALRCSSTVDDMFIVNDWIENVINRYVEVVELSISSYYSPKLNAEIPKQLFVCKTLVVLKNNLKFNLSIPDLDEDVVWFPNLKVFHMVVHNPSEDLEKRLFCNFPVLEDLCVEGSLAED